MIHRLLAYNGTLLTHYLVLFLVPVVSVGVIPMTWYTLTWTWFEFPKVYYMGITIIIIIIILRYFLLNPTKENLVWRVSYAITGLFTVYVSINDTYDLLMRLLFLIGLIDYDVSDSSSED